MNAHDIILQLEEAQTHIKSASQILRELKTEFVGRSEWSRIKTYLLPMTENLIDDDHGNPHDMSFGSLIDSIDLGACCECGEELDEGRPFNEYCEECHHRSSEVDTNADAQGMPNKLDEEIKIESLLTRRVRSTGEGGSDAKELGVIIGYAYWRDRSALKQWDHMGWLDTEEFNDDAIVVVIRFDDPGFMSHNEECYLLGPGGGIELIEITKS